MNTIHVVREAGGLGDVIRIFPFLDGLRENNPDAHIAYWGPKQYEDLVMLGHCRGMHAPIERASYVWTDGFRLRDYRGAPLRNFDVFKGGQLEMPAGDAVYDLYCPAQQHEQQTHGAVTEERSRLFRVDPTVPVGRPVFHLNAADEEFAACWLARMFLKVPIFEIAERIVALHVHPAGLLRAWTTKHWRQLAVLLLERKWIPLFVGADPSEFTDCISMRLVMVASGLTVGAVAGVLSQVRAVIAIDSGIFHLAGALGKPVLGLFGPTNGAIISSCYPTARCIQGPLKRKGCQGACYAFNERGFDGAECLTGCRNLAAIEPGTVLAAFLEMVK
jgi:ADP-heptose:LPS heptosyltransferase